MVSFKYWQAGRAGMPDLSQSVKDEIGRLKEKTRLLEKRVVALEARQGISQASEAEEESEDAPVVSGTAKSGSGSNRAAGIILTVIGAIWSIVAIFSRTVIGLIIGLPLLIMGIYLLAKSGKTESVKDAQPVKAVKAVKSSQASVSRKEAAREPARKLSKAPSKKSAGESDSFEQNVGLKWLGRIGILAIVIGVGYFIKYAFANNWVNHLGRIIIGVAIGLALVVVGELVSKRQKYLAWARTLSGGGFAVMYLSVYLAYHLKEYRDSIGIPEIVDIALLSLIAVAAVVLSFRDNSRIIAGEAFFLGFLTVLFSRNFEFLTLVYGLLLTLGIVAVVSVKKWSAIGIGGIFASYGLYSLWYVDHQGNFLMATFFLVASFFAYTAQSFFLRELKGRESESQNVIAVLLNSAFFFLSYYFALDHSYPSYRGLFALSLSVFYMGLYFAGKEGWKGAFSITSLFLGLLYLTLTVPIQLNREWVTIIWALEAVVLTVLALNLEMRELRIASYAVGGFAAAKAVFYDFFFLRRLDFANLLGSTRAVSVLVTVACFYLMYVALKKNMGEIKAKDVRQEFASASAFYAWAATFLLALLIGLELSAHYSVWVTVLWSLLAVALALLAFSFGFVELNYPGFLVSAVVAFKVLFFDSRLRAFDSADFFGSTRMFAFVSAIVAFYFISAYLEKIRDKLDESEQAVHQLYSWTATALTALLVLLEMSGVWVSVGWAVVAIMILMIGFYLGRKRLRLQGLALLFLTILKVFAYDTRELDAVYRTISFIVLGIILLAASFIYTKYKDKLAEVI